MQSLTNKEIAKVFALYFDNETVIELEKCGYSSPATVDDSIIRNILLKDSHPDKCKIFLLLTPLENISDEDAIEIAKLATNRKLPHYTIDDFSIEKRENAIEVIFLDNLDEIINIGYDGNILVYRNEKNKNSIYHRPLNQSQYFLYLISRGYSVPMYFSIDHACNGRTPIELNIAINKLKQPLTDI